MKPALHWQKTGRTLCVHRRPFLQKHAAEFQEIVPVRREEETRICQLSGRIPCCPMEEGLVVQGLSYHLQGSVMETPQDARNFRPAYWTAGGGAVECFVPGW